VLNTSGLGALRAVTPNRTGRLIASLLFRVYSRPGGRVIVSLVGEPYARYVNARGGDKLLDVGQGIVSQAVNIARARAIRRLLEDFELE